MLMNEKRADKIDEFVGISGASFIQSLQEQLDCRNKENRWRKHG
jgi:hypothetical protein